MASPLILFDLDGTLIETAPDLIDTLNTIFSRHGLPPVPFAEGRKMIGAGVKPLIERGLSLERKACSPSEIDRMYAEYIDHYAQHLADRSHVFPGLVEALDLLASQGYRFAVCTNKLEWLSVLLLDRLGLTPRFAAVCGQDTFGVAKPDPEMVRRTVQAAGGVMERTAFVGDSETDVSAARNAGLPIVGVDFGYPIAPLQEAKPDRLISHFDALPDAIAALLPARIPA